MPFVSYNQQVFLRSHRILTSELIRQETAAGSWASPQPRELGARPRVEPASVRSEGMVAIRVLASRPPQEGKPYTTVVIHTPGGGFIASSSYSHQFYTRRWANELNALVFSLDYHKAPEHPYPHALDEVFQAYLWIIG